MKKITLSAVFVLSAMICFCQEWTEEQMEEANTAGTIAGMSDKEKQVVMYINLCRMYPGDFATIELKDYNGVKGIKDPSMKKYKASLIKDLSARQACEPLQIHELLNNDAKCFARELSKNNRVGHQRKECKGRRYAECLSFGNSSAKEIALAWLIDSNIPSLGHRKNCLNNKYNKTGISIMPHKEYGNCAVAEFWW
jgi:hypothetical protein